MKMVNFKENEELKTLNHSCAHVMAQAIKHLYPQANTRAVQAQRAIR